VKPLKKKKIIQNSKQQIANPQQTTKSNKTPKNNQHSKINQNQIQTANTQNPSIHSEINQITPRDQPKTNQKSSKITKSHRQPLHQEIHVVGPSTARPTPSTTPSQDPRHGAAPLPRDSSSQFGRRSRDPRGRVALGFLKWGRISDGGERERGKKMKKIMRGNNFLRK
jgi:hypothetical protein